MLFSSCIIFLLVIGLRLINLKRFNLKFRLISIIHLITKKRKKKEK